MLALAALLLYLLLVRHERLSDSYGKLFALEWVALLSVYLLCEKQFVPLDCRFSLVFMLFFIPLVLAERYWTEIARYLPDVTLPRVLPVRLYFLLAGLLATASLFLAARVGLQSGIETFMNFRELFTDAEPGSGRPSIGTGISFPLTCGALYLARATRNRPMTLLFGCLTVLLAFLSTSKVFLLIAVLYSLPLNRSAVPALSAVSAARAVAAAFAAFSVLHLLLGKVVGGQEAELVTALLDTFLVYLGSGLAGLQLVLNGEFIYPHNMMWKAVGDLFPRSINVPDSYILPWSQVGDWYGNVYGGLASWYEATGFAGIAVMGFLVGTLHTWLYRSFPQFAFLRIFSMFPLLFLFFQDFYLGAINMWIGFAAVALILAGTDVSAPAAAPEAEGAHV